MLQTCINKSVIDNKSLSNYHQNQVNSQIKLQNKRELKDDFCATEKPKNHFHIVNDSVASNKSQISHNDDRVHLTFNDTFTNGLLDLDFSDGEDEDITMTCDIVTDYHQPTSPDLVNNTFNHHQVRSTMILKNNQIDGNRGHSFMQKSFSNSLDPP